MPSNPPLLTVRDLRLEASTASGRRTVLDSVSFDLTPGETFGLAGLSGSGKSLVAQSIVGTLPPSVRILEGEIRYQGESLLGQSDGVRAKLGGASFGFCQATSAALSPVHNVAWHVSTALQASGAARKPKPSPIAISREQIAQTLKSVNIPNIPHTLRAYPHQLSAGTRQRLQLAMACVAAPPLLVLDDPLRDLDWANAAALLGALRDSDQLKNSAVLLIAHDASLVAEFATTLGVLTDGKIVEQGACGKVMTAPTHACTRKWLAPLPLPDLDTTVGAEPAPAFLRAIRLSKFFSVPSGLLKPPSLWRALRGISLEIAPGQAIGIVGETSSGKTTLARLILRLSEPSLGRIVVNDQDITPVGDHEIQSLRRNIQAVFQDTQLSLNPRMDVRAIVAEPLRVHRTHRSEKAEQNRVEEVLLEVGLPLARLTSRASQLSSGEAQKVALARALCLKPQLLVLDEPIVALSAHEQRQIRLTLRSQRQQFQQSSLVLTHDFRTAFALCDRVLVLHAGSIVESGPAATLSENARHPYTRALLASLPTGDPVRPRLRVVREGFPPSPLQPIVGCGFKARCPRRTELCEGQRPPLMTQNSDRDHEVACWHTGS